MAGAAAELTKMGRDGITMYQAGMTPLVVAGICYLIITVPLSIMARRMENRGPAKPARKRRKPITTTPATQGVA